MALIDISKWLDSFNPGHSDPRFYPTSLPHVLSCMSTPGSHSPSPPPSVDSHDPRCKTPDQVRDPSVSFGEQGSTPSARGAGARKKVEGNSDRVDNYKCSDYDPYILEDLNNRVFVDFEVFLKSVLHVPDDWETQWKSLIEAAKADETFKRYCNEYFARCELKTSGEKSLYNPLMDMANAVLNVISSESSKVPGNRHCYHVDDPKKPRGGVINKATGLSPDLAVLHEDCRPSDGEALHWANVLHALEVKPRSSAICDGKNVCRLKVNGKILRVVSIAGSD